MIEVKVSMADEYVMNRAACRRWMWQTELLEEGGCGGLEHLAEGVFIVHFPKTKN